MSAHECTYCGEETPLPTDVCSPECAQQQAEADAEREMWAEDARRDRIRAINERGAAMAYDAAQARWKGEES